MNIDYSIKIKLHVECKEENIKKILVRGEQQGFKYYDHVMGVQYSEASILDARGATQKIIKAYKDKPEDGPCVYTILNSTTETCAFLWFYKSDDGLLEFQMGAIGCPKKKDMFIDFDYYIRMCLDLCKDFQILEVRTTMDY